MTLRHNQTYQARSFALITDDVSSWVTELVIFKFIDKNKNEARTDRRVNCKKENKKAEKERGIAAMFYPTVEDHVV